MTQSKYWDGTGRSLCRFVLSLGVVAAAAPFGHAQRVSGSNLAELSIEELMQIEVTSVSKHPEKLANAPAAVFALTTDDLRRSAVDNLPDAFRLVPGLNVAGVDAHSWAISARGFADVFANKLLVLRDGRSVYTPLFSGVFWDAQDTMLEDVEQIEVVRGPGATLWGANAVNGVINILSKSTDETVGTLVSASAGTNPTGSFAVRHGAPVAGNAHYRVFAKYTRYDDSELAGGGRASDGWHVGKAGFRYDRSDAAGNLLTVQGDGYAGRVDSVFLLPMAMPPFVENVADEQHIGGANLIARWTGREIAGGTLMAQTYFDYTHRKTAIFSEDRRTYDIELQHRLDRRGAHGITFGAGYRYTTDDVKNTFAVSLSPASRSSGLWNVYLQDDIVVTPERVNLVVGSKFEYNDFTGTEIQPGVRLLLTPGPRHTLWASVARAVRTPSRAEDDVTLNQLTPIPTLFSVTRGSRDFESEKLVAYEAGYRYKSSERLSVDLAVFFNDYTDLRSTEIDPASLPALATFTMGRVTAPLTVLSTLANKLDAESCGGELAAALGITPTWRLRAAYSYLKLDLAPRPDSTAVQPENDGGRSPRHQAYLWSQHDFARGWEFDWRLNYVDSLPSTSIPSYFDLDARIGWRPVDQWEFSISGRNLLNPHHPEFIPATIGSPATEVRRSIQLRIRYDY